MKRLLLAILLAFAVTLPLIPPVVAQATNNFVAEGLIGAVPSPPSLTMITPAGIAYLNGSWLQPPAATFTYAADSITWDYLQSDLSISHVVSPTMPFAQTGLLIEEVFTAAAITGVVQQSFAPNSRVAGVVIRLAPGETTTTPTGQPGQTLISSGLGPGFLPTFGILTPIGGGTGSNLIPSNGQVPVGNGQIYVPSSTLPSGVLPNTAVTPGSYLNANITVDATGRITAAANGSGGGGSNSIIPPGYVTLSGMQYGRELCLSNDGTAAYVGTDHLTPSGHYGVLKINPVTGAVLGTFDTGSTPGGPNPGRMSITPDGSKLLVCDQSVNPITTLWILNTSNMTVANTVTLSPGIFNTNPLQNYDLSTDGTTLAYVDSASQNVNLVDVGTQAQTTIAVGHSSGGANVSAVCFYNGTTNLIVAYDNVGVVDQYQLNGTYVNSVDTGLSSPVDFRAMRSGINRTVAIINLGQDHSGTNSVVSIRNLDSTPQIYNFNTGGGGGRWINPNRHTDTAVCEGDDVYLVQMYSATSDNFTDLYAVCGYGTEFRAITVPTKIDNYHDGMWTPFWVPDESGNVLALSGCTNPTLWSFGSLLPIVGAGAPGNLYISSTNSDWDSVPMSGDATINAAGALTLSTTGVGSGSCTSCNLSFDAKGRITVAANGSGGSGSPGGSSGQLQYNNSGSFGGISGVTSDGTNLTVNSVASFANAAEFAGGALRLVDTSGFNNFVHIDTQNQSVSGTQLLIPDLAGSGDTFMLLNHNQTVGGAKIFGFTNLQLQDSGSDVIQIRPAAQSVTGGALVIPDLAGGVDTAMTLGTVQTLTNSKLFCNSCLQLQDWSTNHVILFTQAPGVGETQNRYLYIPNPLAADDTIMTLGTDQTITGLKSFALNQCTLLDNSSTPITLSPVHQSAGAFLHIPDLGGNDTIAVLGVGQTFSGHNIFTGLTGFQGNVEFNAGKIFLKGATGSNEINIQPVTQTGNSILQIPDLGSTTDAMMTCSTNQTIDGNKTFLPSALGLRDNTTNILRFNASPQSATNGNLNVPDLNGGNFNVALDTNGGQIGVNTTLTNLSARSWQVINSVTIDLPDWTTVPRGTTFWFVNNGGGTVVWDVTGGGAISGAFTVTSNTSYEAIQFKTFNGGWMIVSRSPRGS